jgi:hypothetical protein
MKSSILLVCVASYWVAGCVAVQAGDAAETRGSLAAPVAIAAGAVSDGSDSHVDFTIAGGFADARPVALSIAQPTLRLHTTATGAELDTLMLPLGDVDVPAAALPPSGLALRDLVLSAGPARAELVHAEADALELRATVPLTLSWSLRLDDGTLYRLGDVATTPLVVDVQIARAAGQSTATAQATVRAACDGTCWALDGVARLSDGAVYLAVAAEVTAAE